MAGKPTIRIVRGLARSGGTLFGKCIGCMDKVCLLSEIHPGELGVTNPMMQAQKWFGLINKKDVSRWKIRPPNMLQFVSLCDTRARARGDDLVLRDWSHLDYIGVPYVKPAFGFALGEALGGVYEIRSVNTVRHPVDQYLSLLGLPVVSSKLGLGAYLHGCARYAQYASEHGFYRYEDFTKNPDSVLQSICDDLGIGFDLEYRTKWSGYRTITGDTTPMVGRGSTEKTIRSFDRKPMDEGLLAEIRENEDYQRACGLLGYER